MGINLGKTGPFVRMGDNFPVNTIDVNKAGTSYICVHHQGQCIDKQKHHSTSNARLRTRLALSRRNSISEL